MPLEPHRILPALVALVALTGCEAAIPTLQLNEFMASNTGSLTDDAGGTPDWVELHNPGDDPVDLEGFFLSDNALRLDREALPAGTVVEAGGFALFYLDGSVDEDPQTLSFKLSASGEELFLSYDAGEGAEEVDSILFGEQVPDVSMARQADGGWDEDPTPTPGDPNG